MDVSQEESEESVAHSMVQKNNSQQSQQAQPVEMDVGT